MCEHKGDDSLDVPLEELPPTTGNSDLVRTAIPSYHTDTAAAAERGDIEAAKEILRDFAFGADKYKPENWAATEIPWPYLRYVADALRRVLEAAPDRAAAELGLMHKKAGRPKGGATYDRAALAAAYFLLCRAQRKEDVAVKTLEPKAIRSLLTEYIGAKDDVISEAVSEHQPLEQYSNDDLRAVSRPYAEKITRILSERKLQIP